MRRNAERLRQCIVTRERKAQEGLLRFVAGPDGVLVPDLKGTLPGRGVWVSATRAAVETAVKKRLFARALATQVVVAEDLALQVERRLEEAATGALAIANKAGQVVAGFAKVEAALGKGGVIGLVHAREASADGIAKLAAAARRRARVSGEPVPQVVRAIARDQMDLALGRSNVIHAALLAGGASNSFLKRAGALSRYRGEEAAAAEVRGCERGPASDAHRDKSGSRPGTRTAGGSPAGQ